MKATIQVRVSAIIYIYLYYASGFKILESLKHAKESDLRTCKAINACDQKYNKCSHQCNPLPKNKIIIAPNTAVHIAAPGVYYSCKCPPGMKLGPKMYECLDVDECTENNHLCSGGKCINSDGSYHCQCPTGFRDNGGRCVDVDECEIQNGNCQKFCINTKGSFKCHCGYGEKLLADGYSCQSYKEVAPKSNGQRKKLGCDCIHGDCIAGKCKCSIGWSGSRCDQGNISYSRVWFQLLGWWRNRIRQMIFRIFAMLELEPS